jgi:hypothetical protein
MPDMIRHPEDYEKNWIPAFAGMTIFGCNGREIDPCVKVMDDLTDITSRLLQIVKT